jgi:molybdopterin converting factor small subunit
MSVLGDRDGGEGTVCVRFWASARAAAGVAELSLPAPGELGLDAVVDEVLARLPGRGDLGRVLGVCSVLVGDRPTGVADRAGVTVPPGATVEFLPPFAGG